MKKSISFVVFILVVAASWAVYSYLFQKHTLVVDSALQERAYALKRLDATLNAGVVPHSWDVGAYIPYVPVNDAVGELKSLKLKSNTLIPGEEIEFRVKQFALGGNNAVASATIGLEAVSASRNLHVDLVGDAQVSFKGVGPLGAEGTRMAHFAVHITKLSPRASLNNFRAIFVRPANQLITAPLIERLNAEINGKLVLGVPFPCPQTVPIGISETESLPVGKAKIALKIDMPEFEIPVPTDFTSAVFTKQGVWLMINRERLGEEFAENRSMQSSRAGLEKMINRLESSIETKLKSVLQSPMAMAWVHSRVLTRCIADFGDLPQERRTISARTEKCEGNLVDEKWRDNILGDGGFRVGSTKSPLITVTGIVGAPVTTWVPNQGLNYTLPVMATAQANVHAHVDPLIGGGIGTDIGVSGTAAGTVSGRVVLLRSTVDDHDIIYVDPSVSALPLVVAVETGGNEDFGFTKVPKLELTVRLELPGSTIPAFSFVDGLPVAFVSLEEALRGTGFALTADSKQHLQVRFHPEAVKATADGFLINSRFAMTLSDEPADMEAVKAQRRLIQKSLVRQQRAKGEAAGKLTSVNIEVGEIDIIPGNAVYALLYEWGKKSIEEIQQLAKAVGHEFSAEAIKEKIRNPGDAYRGSDLGKGGRALEDIVNDQLPTVDSQGVTIPLPILPPWRIRW